MYRLVALDVDGTLLDSAHRLSTTVRDTLIETQRRGVVICLATGKLLVSVADLRDALGLTGLQITCNGAALMDASTGAAVQIWPLQADARARSIAAIREIAPQEAIAWYTSDAIYTDAARGELDAILARYHEPPIRHIERLNDSLPPSLKLLMTGDPQRLASINKRLSARLESVATVMRTTADFCEVVATGVSKGAALAAVAQRLGIARDEIVAIGDGENDIALLDAAGLGIAMGNAMPRLVPHAQAMTASADDDGVAHALASLGLAPADSGPPLRWL